MTLTDTMVPLPSVTVDLSPRSLTISCEPPMQLGFHLAVSHVLQFEYPLLNAIIQTIFKVRI